MAQPRAQQPCDSGAREATQPEASAAPDLSVVVRPCAPVWQHAETMLAFMRHDILRRYGGFGRFRDMRIDNEWLPGWLKVGSTC